MDFSPAGLIVSTLLGAVGFVLFRYGRKCDRLPQVVSGLVLMVFPSFVPGVAWMLGLAAVVLADFWACLRAGM